VYDIAIDVYLELAFDVGVDINIDIDVDRVNPISGGIGGGAMPVKYAPTKARIHMSII